MTEPLREFLNGFKTCATETGLKIDKVHGIGNSQNVPVRFQFKSGRSSPEPRLLKTLSSFGGLLLAVISLSGCQTVPTRIRVLAYNIHHGEGTDGRLDLERTAAVIRESNADLVALQEVDNRTQRTGRVAQTDALGRLTHMRAVFGKAIDFEGGQYGAAILSRWEIEEAAPHVLPGSPGHEQRPALLARVRPVQRGPRLSLVSVHLDHKSEDERIAQTKRLLELLARERPGPVLVAGDLNATPDSFVLSLFGSGWTNATAGHDRSTIPSERPTRQIDYVLCYPVGRWRVIESHVIQSPASDHCALLVTLELLRPD